MIEHVIRVRPRDPSPRQHDLSLGIGQTLGDGVEALGIQTLDRVVQVIENCFSEIAEGGRILAPRGPAFAFQDRLLDLCACFISQRRLHFGKTVEPQFPRVVPLVMALDATEEEVADPHAVRFLTPPLGGGYRVR